MNMLSVRKLKILVFLFLLDSIALTESICSPSLLGCLCQNIENITEKEVEPCCSKKMETLIITGKKVRNISIEIERSNCAENFINLMITETSITKFFSLFKGLNNVSSVNIEKNQNLSDFHKLIFKDINPNILNIYVEYNTIRTISKKTFANLTRLVTLKLSDNKIGYIDDHSFMGLKNLNSLNMNNNILTLLTSEIFYGLESLTVLSLLNNPLQDPKVNDLFKYVKNLRHLLMSHGSNVESLGINQLPEDIFFSVKQLKTLNMTNIWLKNLTARSFYGLQDLERLDLQSNKLSIIPSGTLQQVPKIGSINLSKNQITCLYPDTFQNLPKLTNLDLSQNELSYISEDVFKNLRKLQTLDLAENNIYVIEKNAFVGLYSLMVIKINVIHGRAKNEIQMKFISSSLAKLRNTTKIIGLREYFGITNGKNQPADKPEILSNGSLKILQQKMACPVASVSDKDWVDFNTTGSRKYLLIIVGICVVFLLIAFTIIMTYRAWSKRRMGEIGQVEDGDEKQEMLQTKGYVVNGRPDQPVAKANHHHSRKSINGNSGHDQTANANLQHEHRHSNSQLTTMVKPSTISDGRGHSDDESALTPLGVL